MNTKNIAFLGGIALIAVVLIGVLSAQTQRNTSGFAIAATVNPVADMAQRVLGDTAEVELILDPGASPHTFELTPRKATRLSQVDAIFGIGHGLDSWAEDTANIGSAAFITLDEHVDLHCGEDVHVHSDDEHHDEDEHGHDDHGHEEDEHGHDEDEHEEDHADEAHDDEHEEETIACDPHYWLSVQSAEHMVEQLVEELSALNPTHADLYAANAATYIEELSALDDEVTETLAGVENPHIITFHDSYHYMAEAYGFEVVGTFEPTPGREPTPRQLAELQDLVGIYNIQTLYSEPQLSDRAVQAFVNDLNVAIMELDPLGGTDGRTSYVELMRYNANIIAQNQ